MKKIISFLLVIATVISFSTFKNTDESSFEDKIVENIVDPSNEVSAIIKLNYIPLENNSIFTDDLTQSQEILLAQRRKNQQYYKGYNEKFLSAYKLDCLDVDVSEFSPFIFIEFDDYSDYEER